MPNIIITTPVAMIPIVNKGQFIANRKVHLETLSDTEFEEFTYWLYKTEIDDGAWKGTFDEIRLIQASSDKGRDCALYKNGKLGGVMQCKHSVNPTNTLSESAFAKEIIKFGLYSIVFATDLPLFKDIPYYIVSNTGFKESCEDLIDDFRNRIDAYGNLQKYANAAIAEYASLKGLVFATVEQELKDNLKKLSIIKIKNDDLKRVLLKPYQIETLSNFFQYMPVVNAKLLAPIEAKLADVTKKLDDMVSPPPPERPKPIFFDGVYLTRYVHSSDSDFFAYILDSHETLEDQLRQHHHLALIGWGQTGKSTALLHLTSILSGLDHDDHVFFIRLDDYPDKDIKELIPRFDERPSEKVLVIMDGLDEVLPQFYGTAVNKIKSFTREFPLVRTVVSCRENFYAIYGAESDQNTLPHYKSLRLKDLDDDTINKHLKSFDNFDFSTFLRKLKEAELEELIRIPFYLIKFATEFHKSGKIIQGKSALFNELFEDGVEEAIKNKYPRDINKNIPILKDALEQLAFTMEVQAKNFFTLEDLSKIVEQPMVDLIQEAGTIIYGSAENGGQWRFVHHHMQEYLAARILSRQTPDFIKGVLTRDDGQKVIRPSWAHTISFMIGMFESANPLRKEILDLLVVNEPGLLMQFEPENLTKDIRHIIFKKLMETASVQDKRLHRSKFEPAKLARFSQTEDNIRYAITLLKNPSSDIQLSNLLEVVGFYQLATFPGLKAELKQAIEQRLNHTEDYTRFLAVRALVQLFKLNAAEYQILFNKFQFASDSHIRFILFHSIWQQGYTEQYLSYALTHIRQIMIEEGQSFRNGGSGSRRLGNENYELLNIVQSVNSEAGALKLVNFWGNNLSMLSHTIAFREYRKYLFELAEKLQSDSVFGQVVGYFITNQRQFAGNYAFTEVANYFLSTGRQGEVSKSIYQSTKTPAWEHFILIVQILDQDGFDFFAAEAASGRLTAGQAQMLQSHIADRAPDWAAKWNTVVNQNYQIPPPLVIDREAERLQEAKRKTDALFDPEIFKNEVRAVFAAVGKDPLRYDDLHVLDIKDRVNYHVYYWVYTNLERKFNYTGEYNLQGVLHDLDQLAEIARMSKIYLLLKEQKDTVLENVQRKLLKDWVDKQMKVLDFKTSFEFMSDNGGVEPELDPMVICSYLLRKFEMKEYPKEKYLDLLSTFRYNDQEQDVFEFVLSVCNSEQVTERAFENLSSGTLKYQVLENHIDYLLGQKLTDGVDLLIPYLENKDTYQWANVLAAFKKLNGDVKKLQGLLDKLDGYEQGSVISAFLDADPSFIRQWLTDKMKNPLEEKTRLRYARQLIRLQNRKGLEAYFDIIRAQKKVPDSSAPGNPLYNVHDLSLLDLALEIYQFAYEGDYLYDPMSDFKSITTQMLNVISFTGDNFPTFQIAFRAFLKEKEDEQPKPDEKRQQLLYQAKYWFEGVEHQYYLKDEKPFDLNEAINIAKQLK